MTTQTTTLKRSLTTRHLTLIALGGSIGTGLFVASGATISQAGAAGALIAYALIGTMVYFLMTSLGELSTYEPVSGSFATYGEKYVDAGFGFAMGVNYCFNWNVAVAVDLVAAQIVMQYWFPNVNGLIWSALFLTVIFLLNFFSAKNFGEAESWFASIKVFTVIVFIIVGLLMIVGVLKGEQNAGFHIWAVGEGAFVGGIPAILSVALVVGYSFQGTELIAVTAGETHNPSEAIPRAIRQIFWRILLFYVLSIFVISLLIPYTDPRLLQNDITDIAVSPFTLVFENAGLLSAAAVMNAIILTTVLSAGNSGMYASTRMIYTLAKEGKLPAFLARLTPSGVPRNALYATTAISALCFLTSLFEEQTVYLWLLNTTAMGGFICWIGIAVCHYRFRKGYVLQGKCLKDLPYRSPFYPVGPIIAGSLCFLIATGQNYQAIIHGRWMEALATYIGAILFLSVWGGYRLLHRDCRLVKYEEMDLEPRQHG